MAHPQIQNPPFESVTVDWSPAGSAVVHWSMESSYNPSTPVTYEVEWAHRGSDSWQSVGSVQDQFWLQDASQRSISALSNGYYRVIATDDGGTTATSDPSDTPTTWGERDLKMANELRRREHKLYDIAGVDCWVLFRRHWGAECPDCTSPTTGEVRNPQCQVCYGTGRVGGYFRPFRTALLPGGSAEDIQQTLITTVSESAQVRMCAAFPVREEDVIVVDGGGGRYEVEKTKVAGEWKGRVMVQEVQMRRLDPTDIIFDVTWDGTTALETSQSETWIEPGGDNG